MKAISILVIAVAALWAPLVHAQDDVSKKQILYLNSYHNGYAWSDQIQQGVRDALDASSLPHDLLVEYMDTKRYPEALMEQTMFALLQSKYAGVKLDLIMVSDDNAFQFMLRYQEKLFPGTPVIFSGVNDLDPSMLVGRDNFTGVVEYPDFKANFLLAKKLIPGLNRVVMVGDTSITGLAIAKQITTAVEPIKDQLKIEYHHVKTVQELLELTTPLTEHDMVFMIPTYLGSGNRILPVEEVLDILSEHTKAQVYSGWQFQLGHGIVGGRLHSGHVEGEIMAKMAARVFGGESPKNIPIVDTFDDPYMFDHNVLRRFNINEKLLPQGSTIINEPLSFYTINKQIFWIIVCSFLFLMFILVLLVTSILQKRSVEMQIKNQLFFLNILMDTIPLPLSYRNVDGRYMGCNLAFEKWFGVNREELLENSNHPLAKRMDDAYRQLFNKPGIMSYEAEVADSSGDKHWAIVTKATYKNAKGDLAGVVEAILDITLRRDAEKALRRSQAMLQTVINNIPQLVYWKDMDLRYLGVNRSFLDFFALSGPQDIVGKQSDALLPLDAAGTSDMDSLRVLATDNAEHRRALTLDLPGRDPVQLEMNIVPLHDDAGKVVGVLGTAEDVTVKKNLERQLLQSQKMEAIGALAGGIAHDFNNILTSIINSTELALMDVPEGSDTKADLERTIKAAQRGSRLVKHILAFSRSSQEGFVPTDVADVVREALAIFAATLPRNITLSEKFPDRPAVAFADPTQLHQIVMNLFANAYQAMRDTGGHMAVELCEVGLTDPEAELVSLPEGRYLRLTVTDNGPGISLEIMDRIFDPFFTTKAKGEGTGLGLAVVHGIVKSHQGGLRVTSQPGQRTSFEIFLPAYETLETLSAVQTIETPAPGRREHVLFIEDDEDQLRVIPRVLSLNGYRVTARRGAHEALEFLAHSQDKVVLVITDFDMPDMSGVELAERLLEQTPELPVILVSGRRGALTAAERAGNIKDVLLKPYNGHDLMRTIAQVLDLERV
jgi:PAS domain S-box-containing protein